MNTIDRDGPPDGDYASYVERLTGAAGRTPGRVESRVALARRDARPAPSRSAGEPAAQPAGTFAEAAAEALRRAADGARRQAGAANRGAGAKGASGASGTASADALRAAGRALGLRLSRWLMIGGFALIALAILDLVPAMTPLPGFALLLLSLVLRNLSNR
ncbi:MAG: hypothetical protein KF822_13395 [Steroidobacteraceae bacterium]|nr:hypothetical protein [Steroidobacteraceae bacterium]